MTEPIRFNIDKLLNNGCGMGRLNDGRVVFVPDALPGETIAADHLRKRKNVWWAEDFQRLSLSPLRAEPACPHFNSCGGCGLLHVARAEELGQKLAFLKDGLQRIAKREDLEIRGIDYPLACSRIRGKLHADGKGGVGFLAARATRVSAINACLVLPPVIMETVIPFLKDLGRRSGLNGEIHFNTDVSGRKACLSINTNRKTAERTVKHLGRLPDGIIGVGLNDEEGMPLHQSGEPDTVYHWNGIAVTIAPTGFTQSNPLAWPFFFDQVNRLLKIHQPRVIWDAHAGAGFLCTVLRGRRILASEPDKRAFQQLEQVLAHEALEGRAWHGTAEQAISAPDFPVDQADAVLLDPPRAGLTNELLHWLVQQGPAHLLYFSCDMGTFARDLKALGSTYQPTGPIYAINHNPGTLKLETALTLQRK